MSLLRTLAVPESEIPSRACSSLSLMALDLLEDFEGLGAVSTELVSGRPVHPSSGVWDTSLDDTSRTDEFLEFPLQVG
jgi:hypothetical protein